MFSVIGECKCSSDFCGCYNVCGEFPTLEEAYEEIVLYTQEFPDAYDVFRIWSDVEQDDVFVGTVEDARMRRVA